MSEVLWGGTNRIQINPRSKTYLRIKSAKYNNYKKVNQKLSLYIEC